MKYQKKFICIYTVLLCSLYTLPLASPKSYKIPSDTSIQDILKQVTIPYQNQSYTQVIDTLTHILSLPLPQNHEEPLIVFLIDTYLQRGTQKDIQKAKDLIYSFKIRFQNSTYTPHILYYQSLIYGAQEENFNAGQTLVQAINKTSSPALFQRAKAKLSQLLQKNTFSIQELQVLLQSLMYDQELLAQVLLSLGDAYVQQKNFKAARISYKKWLSYFSNTSLATQVQERLSDIIETSNPNQTLLIMLPMTGIHKKIGEALYKGISLALNNSPFWQRKQYQYEIINTEGDPILAIQHLRKKLQEYSVIGILGPAMSHVSTVVGVEVSNLSNPIPMITPTATTQGIASLGNNIFQTNVTTNLLGKSLANYAIKCKNILEYAILAPDTPYGKELAQAFQKQILKHKGTILATEYYNPNKPDYATQFRVIKSRKAKQLLAQDTSAFTKKTPRLNNETNEVYYTSEPLSRKEKSQLLDTWAKDSLITIDGLFLVARNAKEAEALYSQALYHKITATILGSPDWYDESFFYKQLPRTNDVIFNIDFLPPDQSEPWIQFQKQFQKTWGHAPNTISILGYDAAQFLLTGLQKDSPNPTESLQNISIFSGLRSDITMNTLEGSNATTFFLRMGKQTFETLENCME